MLKLTGKLSSALDWLVTAGGKISAYAVIVVTLIVTMDVTARFLLGAGTKWAVEFTAYFLVAIVFFGLAYTHREGAHIRIDFLFVRLPRKVQGWLEVVNSVLFLAYALFLGVLGLESVVTSFMRETTSRTGVDVIIWPFQLFMPLGLAIISLLLIRKIYMAIKSNTRKNQSSSNLEGVRR